MGSLGAESLHAFFPYRWVALQVLIHLRRGPRLPFSHMLGVISFGEALHPWLFKPVSSCPEEVQTEAGEQDLTFQRARTSLGMTAGGPRLAQRRNALTFVPGLAAFCSSWSLATELDHIPIKSRVFPPPAQLIIEPQWPSLCCVSVKVTAHNYINFCRHLGLRALKRQVPFNFGQRIFLLKLSWFWVLEIRGMFQNLPVILIKAFQCFIMQNSWKQLEFG